MIFATSSGVSSESAPEAETYIGSKSSGEEHPTEPGAPCDDSMVCNVSIREIPDFASASISFETENKRVVICAPGTDSEAKDLEADLDTKREPVPVNSRETKAIEVRHSQAAAMIWVILILQSGSIRFF